MKRTLMAAAAFAMVAGAASVHAEDAHRDFHINGWVAAECHIHSNGNTANIGLIANEETAQVHQHLAGQVAEALNDLDVTAWCNGNHNGVNLTRSALVNHSNHNGDGLPDSNGFNDAALYDLEITIDGAKRADTGASPLEDTCDGPFGPGYPAKGGSSVSDFGSSGAGAAVHFHHATLGGCTDGEAVTSFTSGKSERGPDSDFGHNTNRLAAGHYHGLVRLLLVPRV
jgi:hypothetical protein